MTQPTKPRPPRKHNPAWADSKEARAARQAKRNAGLNELARASSFESWTKLETAALAGARIVLNDREMVVDGLTALRVNTDALDDYAAAAVAIEVNTAPPDPMDNDEQ